MTVSRPCYFGNLLLGVVGVDVNLAYILEDVTYYQDSLASYTFLIDNKGQSETCWVRVNAAVIKWFIPGCRKGVKSSRGWISRCRKSTTSFTTCVWLQLQLLQLHN